MGSTIVMMMNLGVIFGTIAAGYWFLRGQSIWKGFGFTFHWRSLEDLGAGALIAALAWAGIFLVEWLTGSFRVIGIQFNAQALISGVSGQVFTAVFEEIISRALQLNGIHIAIAVLVALLLTRVRGGTYRSNLDAVIDQCKWPAILISSMLFGYAHLHNTGATYLTAFGNALGGVMYGIAFLGGRNIWLPIGMHFAWNFVQAQLGFIVSGNTPSGFLVQQSVGFDLLTGGIYGPEGGLVGMSFRFVVMTMVLFYLHLRSERNSKIALLDFPRKVFDNLARRS